MTSSPALSPRARARSQPRPPTPNPSRAAAAHSPGLHGQGGGRWPAPECQQGRGGALGAVKGSPGRPSWLSTCLPPTPLPPCGPWSWALLCPWPVLVSQPGRCGRGAGPASHGRLHALPKQYDNKSFPSHPAPQPEPLQPSVLPTQGPRLFAISPSPSSFLPFPQSSLPGTPRTFYSSPLRFCPRPLYHGGILGHLGLALWGTPILSRTPQSHQTLGP